MKDKNMSDKKRLDDMERTVRRFREEISLLQREVDILNKDLASSLGSISKLEEIQTDQEILFDIDQSGKEYAQNR